MNYTGFPFLNWKWTKKSEIKLLAVFFKDFLKKIPPSFLKQWISIEIKLYPLSKRQLVTEVYGASTATHVLLPRIWTRLSTTTSLFFTAKSATDLWSRSSDICVNNSAVWTQRADPLLAVLNISSEDRRWETLRHVIVESNSFLKRFKLNHVEDRHKKLMLENLCVSVDFDDGWVHIVSLASFDHSSAEENFSALSLSLSNTVFEGFDLNLSLKWAQESAWVQGVSDPYRGVSFYYLRCHFVKDRFLNKKSS